MWKNIVSKFGALRLYVSTPKGKLVGVRQINSDLPPDCWRRFHVANLICSSCYHIRHILNAPYGRAQSAQMEENYCETRSTVERIGRGQAVAPDLSRLRASKIRFNGFGELHSFAHFLGFVEIARANPSKQFALYSKLFGKYSLLQPESFRGLPRNLCLVQSAWKLNEVVDSPIHPRVDTVFMVGDKIRVAGMMDYYKSVKGAKPVYCHDKVCDDCGVCYKRHNRKTLFVVEQIK